MPGGLIAERWGPTHVVGYTGIISGILTMLIPAAASIHHGLVIAIRLALGLAGVSIRILKKYQ